MLKILVCSIFRDMVEHPNWKGLGSPLKACLEQLEKQEDNLSNEVEFTYSFYESDSMDETPEVLERWAGATRVSLVSEKIEAPRYRSLPADTGQDRIRWLAKFRNRALEKLADEDWVLFIESDIVYSPETLRYLLSMDLGDIRSPLSFSHPTDLTTFYDPLSTRDLEGRKFRWAWPPPPNDADMVRCVRGHPIEVSSTFNCFCLIRADLIRAGVRFSGEVEGESEASMLCKSAREKGARIFVFPAIRYSVIHPLASQAWRE